MASEKTETNFPGWIYPTILGLIVLAVFVVRLLINFGTDLIPGTNGAYYLIQARSVAQTGKMAFSDSPLIFYLQGYFSLFVNLFIGNLDKSIVFSVKFLDSILPALCALPLYLISKTLIKDRKVLITTFAPIAFCAFHFYGFLLAGDLQKNALGLVFLLFFILNLLLAFSNQKARSFTLAGLFFMLCGLTHMAVFGLAIFILFASTLLWFFFSRKKPIGITKFVIVSGILLGLVLLTSVTFLLQGKTQNLFSIILFPIKLLTNPYLFTMISSVSTPMGNIPLPEIISMIFNHAVIALSIWVLSKNWKSTDAATKTIVISLILACLMLSSPLIGRAYALRFYILSYIPASVLLVCLFIFLNMQWKKVFMVLTSIFIIFSIVSITKLEAKPSIGLDVYKDLIAFKSQLAGNTGKSIAVAKHGLEWWAGWTLGVAVTQEYFVAEETFENFANVFYLVEKPPIENQPAQTGQIFPDVVVPEASQIVFEGRSLMIYKADAPAQIDVTNAPPLAMGMIIDAGEDFLTIVSPEGQKTIMFDGNTKLEEGLILQRGTAVKIWGEEMFLSPDLRALLIIKDKNPMKPPEPPMRK